MFALLVVLLWVMANKLLPVTNIVGILCAAAGAATVAPSLVALPFLTLFLPLFGFLGRIALAAIQLQRECRLLIARIAGARRLLMPEARADLKPIYTRMRTYKYSQVKPICLVT
jgi:hypothetical protein